MKSVTSRQFREMYAALPLDVRRHARRAYAFFREDASHPGLRLKKTETHGIYIPGVVGLLEPQARVGCVLSEKRVGSPGV